MPFKLGGHRELSSVEPQTIDAADRVVLPGLIDAHVQVVASVHDLPCASRCATVVMKAGRVYRDRLQPV